MVEELKAKIGKTETAIREKSFDNAIKFIEDASKKNGVNAIVKKTFKVKGTKDIRVDIEVLKGTAFL